jgi:arylformamidase
MHTYDITLTISPSLPVWPGDPAVKIERVQEIAKGDPVTLSRVEMSLHTGTHVDAPEHFLGNGKTVENLPLNILMGRVYVLHIPDADLITASMLEEAEIPPRTRRILFKTRNSEYWAKKILDFQTNFVGISPDAAQYLVDRSFKLVGIDYLSIAPYQNSHPAHEILLKAGVVILEGVDLSKVSEGRYTLHCLPMKIAGAEGAPARAILVGV